MTEGDKARLIAWGREMRSVHERLRDAVRVVSTAAADGEAMEPASRDLLHYCHGFCAALIGHHRSEDSKLFPAIAAAHPEMRQVLGRLEQDHSTIAHLLTGLEAAAARSDPPAELDRHLEGIAAIMENHFRYEERRLLTLLDELELDADPRDVLGPL